ncbi:hypothetical protein SAMN06264855_1541 [Halorubrum vacuolatum]|uniref:Uncharacterized protein n=1 Tax=Halorubrum vacuolatum TaxID=63740 RepID=A0A238YKY7_HALVU|nr:hypothetical protein SAMN06264855_1541 [Halorubrum vacuolatum]
MCSLPELHPVQKTEKQLMLKSFLKAKKYPLDLQSWLYFLQMMV